jgi:DNA-binding response OmpR family regulator
MSTTEKILVVYADPITQQLLGLICHSYQVQFTPDNNQALAQIDAFQPHLIILEANASGYHACRQLKSGIHAAIPVLLLSETATPENRIEAFSAGAEDYITLPFDLREISKKIDRILSNVREKTQLSGQLSETQRHFLELQTQTAQMHTISRFHQACLFCRDMQELTELFFDVSQDFEMNCVLRLQTGSGQLTRSQFGNATQLEQEIFSVGQAAGRIRQFGHNRALFNWGKTQLLVRNLGDKADMVALLLNGVEVGRDFIEKEISLLRAIESLEAESHLIQKKFAELFTDMAEVLKDAFLSISLKVSMSEEEEAQMYGFVDSYSQACNRLIDNNKQNTQHLFQMIRTFRTQSDAIATDQGKPSSARGIELF